jgi:hypothetical protein
MVRGPGHGDAGCRGAKGLRQAGGGGGGTGGGPSHTHPFCAAWSCWLGFAFARSTILY